MRGWLKRILLGVAALLAVAAVLGVRAHRLSLRPPEWFHPYQWRDDQRGLVAQRAIDKMTDAQNMAAQAQAQERRNSAGSFAATAVVKPVTQTFTEEELSAFLEHALANLSPSAQSSVAQYVEHPGIYLRDGCIVLAGEARPLGGRVVSLYFRPTIEPPDRMRLELERITGGQQTIPRILLDNQLSKIRDALAQRTAALAASAKLGRNGNANADAAGAALGQLLLDTLDDKPSPTTLLVPVDLQFRDYLAVRVTEITVGDQSLTISVAPLTSAQQKDVVERIRKGS